MQNRNELIKEMLDKYSDMVYRIALTRCKNKDSAEDVYQTVFLRYSEKMPKFESEEHSKAWFIRVTINLTKDENTSSWNNKIVALDDMVQFESKEESDLFIDICKLPQNYKSVIYLMYYEGYKVKEISKLLDASEGTIKTWLYRAREILKESIEGGV